VTWPIAREARRPQGMVQKNYAVTNILPCTGVTLGLCKADEGLLYAAHTTVPDSSAVEQSTVNRLVASSNLAQGANRSSGGASPYFEAPGINAGRMDRNPPLEPYPFRLNRKG
jgi:hypothetical protein